MSTAISELLKKKQELEAEQNRIYSDFQTQIDELSAAIETLSGKKIVEFEKGEFYDDQNPNYIKGSFEEI